MKFPRRKFLQMAAAAVAVPPLSLLAQAQAWPSRPVRLVVGFPAGGGADAAARIAANRLSEAWGQQVVIENKGGAGGNIAIDAVAHAPPDGYSGVRSSRRPTSKASDQRRMKDQVAADIELRPAQHASSTGRAPDERSDTRRQAIHQMR